MKPDWQRIPVYTGDYSAPPFDGESVLIWKWDEHMVGSYMMIAYFDDQRADPGFVPVGGHHKQGYFSQAAGRPQGYPTHWAPLPEVPDRETWVWEE